MSIKTKVSDIQRTEELLQLYAAQKQAKADAAQKMKDIEAQVAAISERNPDWFEESLTQTFDNGKVKMVTDRKILPGKKFDMADFSAAYPGLVKTDFAKGATIQALTKGLVTADLSIEQTHNLKIEV